MITSMLILVRKRLNEWHTQIESKDLQVSVDLSLSDDGPSIVRIDWSQYNIYR